MAATMHIRFLFLILSSTYFRGSKLSSFARISTSIPELTKSVLPTIHTSSVLLFISASSYPIQLLDFQYNHFLKAKQAQLLQNLLISVCGAFS
ncbi:hypothetical protein BT96DRAFT_923526 [Gymnopus androsaceus JB14]|uniref:Uncharacterized protein n=1 Tax=Gymnopus androsaceus JB14 TaxID=1447944 RepID=A0A6A4H9X5_9AGAR|nr:hypothetical protein BT96DRAFT_923526 [Gymnopus androsaceus JB14]